MKNFGACEKCPKNTTRRIIKNFIKWNGKLLIK
jgi:hypothetical protein